MRHNQHHRFFLKKSLFIVSIKPGYVRIARALLVSGANPRARADGGETPLHFAAVHGSPSMVRLLLGVRADPAARDEDGRTPVRKIKICDEIV